MHCSSKPKPFEYEVFDNFLDEKDFEEIVETYRSSPFLELKSDLFSFLQTRELVSASTTSYDTSKTDADSGASSSVLNKTNLKFFTDRLDKIFNPKILSYDKKATEVTNSEHNSALPLTDPSPLFYTIFASFYRPNDFLLVHDDCIENREYAFTFYLSDLDTGRLILYENDCMTVFEKVEIKRNRLVIFKVGRYSYHEVERVEGIESEDRSTSTSDLNLNAGRQAITGWINNSKKLPWENYSPQCSCFNLSLPDEIQYIDIPIDIPETGYSIMELGDFDFEELSYETSGPFVDRRAVRINIEEYFAPKVDNYRLIHLEYLMIERNGYILINDRINTRTHDCEKELHDDTTAGSDVHENPKSILDMFIFKNDCDRFINFVNEQGEIEYELDAVAGCMLFGLRNGRRIFVRNSDKEVKFIHLIYKEK